MNKKISSLFFVLLTAALFCGKLASAQSTNVQKAVLDVKDRVDELVVARDENEPNDLALRVSAFKKVLSLSLVETKELKVRLLTLELPDENAFKAWREKMLSGLNVAFEYFERQDNLLNETDLINLDLLKRVAEDFKKWREENYLPIANQVNDFIIIGQEENAIQIAEKRAQKIGEDILKLEKSKILGIGKNLSGLNTLLDNAKGLTTEANNLNNEANNLFSERFVYINEFAPTSTPPIPSESDSFLLISTSTVTSTDSNALALEALPPLSPSSIRDLVKSSLSKIKESYQIFIEMSNFVRNLLS